MPRFTEKNYRRQVWILMAIYVAVMLFAWPHASHVASLPLKATLALSAAAPVVALIWLMARRVMDSDELQQRLHLVALSAATGVVAALSLVGGFLRASGVLVFDGDILIWVFPVLCVTYSAARWLYAQRYGGTDCG